MAHWEYIVCAVGGPAGLATWRYAPRAFLMIVGGLTKDLQRSKQCAEMLRLQRKDAKELSSYLTDSPDGNSRPPGPSPQPDQGNGAAASAPQATSAAFGVPASS
jgi:hypothetical protein